MGWLLTLASELAITLGDGAVWLAIGEGLLFGAACLLFGAWIARFVGLLSADAPAGETLGVGLASGLMVLAAWWAAVASGGRSSFTPVAIGFAVALGFAMVRRWRAGDPTPDTTESAGDDPHSPSRRRRNLVVAVAGGAVFVLALALLYGSTLIQSPRDGLQPLEFNDVAFYSILGANVAKTGTETIYSPSGFAVLDGLPPQTLYHWGELWLAAAATSIFGMPALAARHLVVLPLLMLAAASLTGTLVRRMTGARSSGAFFLGFLASLFLMPVPLLPGPFFSSFARGLTFGITAYGLAAAAVLLALYGLTVVGRRPATWALCIFAGSAVAFTMPAHIVIAFLALVGVGSVWTVRTARSLIGSGRLPVVSTVWRRTFIATAVAASATVAWVMLTGHDVVTSDATVGVAAFSASWRASIAIIALGAGAFLAIPIAWLMVRKQRSLEADFYLGTGVLVIVGAIAWGALLADIFSIHAFFAAIVVFATPAAAAAIWSIGQRLRANGHRALAIAVLVLCGSQILMGSAISVVRLQEFGPNAGSVVPTGILEAIMNLPPDAKLAYACRPLEELAFWEPRLLGIDVHTGHRIVPICFQADISGILTGTPISADVPGPLFGLAPQHAIYPDSATRPSATAITAFLKANGIDYVYADAMHPNILVPDAVPVTTSDEYRILRLR